MVKNFSMNYVQTLYYSDAEIDNLSKDSYKQ